MTDQPPGEPTIPPDSPYERPPLGIRHLMLWTACTGAYLAVATGILSWQRSEPAAMDFFSVMRALYSLSAGLALAGGVLLIRPFFRRVRLAPGELLLLMLGGQVLATMGRFVTVLGWLDDVVSLMASTAERDPGGSTPQAQPEAWFSPGEAPLSCIVQHLRAVRAQATGVDSDRSV